MKRLLALAALLVALSGQSGEPGRPVECARRLGIAWSVADGATEQLDSFAGCVR